MPNVNSLSQTVPEQWRENRLGEHQPPRPARVKINPRPAGPLDFPQPERGLLLALLLCHVATRDKRHSEERQKS